MIKFFYMCESDHILNMLLFFYIHSFVDGKVFSIPCLGYCKRCCSALLLAKVCQILVCCAILLRMGLLDYLADVVFTS